MNDAEITEPFLRKLKDTIDADPNLTVSGLAVAAGLDNSVIRRWYAPGSKISPKIETARKICEVLGTTLEEFLSDARTEEEKAIVRLVSRLPDHLRLKLLGYGEGLLAAEGQPPKKADKDDR